MRRGRTNPTRLADPAWSLPYSSSCLLDAGATEIEEAKQIMAPTLTPRDEPSESAAASSVERGTDQTSKSADAAPIAENGGSR